MSSIAIGEIIRGMRVDGKEKTNPPCSLPLYDEGATNYDELTYQKGESSMPFWPHQQALPVTVFLHCFQSVSILCTDYFTITQTFLFLKKRSLK